MPKHWFRYGKMPLIGMAVYRTLVMVIGTALKCDHTSPLPGRVDTRFGMVNRIARGIIIGYVSTNRRRAHANVR